MSDYVYEGQELELFQHAVNWKSYLRREIRPYLRGDVAEVGAGIGGTMRLLCGEDLDRWFCIEPDAALVEQLRGRLDAEAPPSAVEIVLGTLADVDAGRRFDAVIYIDVLEHIEHDADEMKLAASRLKPGGVIVVLSPAHPWLFTDFDRAIGHFRRYTLRSLAAVTPDDVNLERLVYLDSVGLLASVANRFMLRQNMPTLSQVRTWDRLLVPASRVLDPCLFRRVGKSVLGVWRKSASAQVSPKQVQ